MARQDWGEGGWIPRTKSRTADATCPGGSQAKGEEKLGRLLALNRTDVAKVGLDLDGDLALLYEVPALYEGLLDHLISQFTPLLLGAMLAG